MGYKPFCVIHDALRFVSFDEFVWVDSSEEIY